MNSTDLYGLFRGDVRDVATPYLWTDEEVFAYMNHAYTQYFRLIGGINDATGPVTQVTVTAGEEFSDISPTILQIRAARRQSDFRELSIINFQDVSTLSKFDYGVARPQRLDDTQGPVTALIVGMEPNKVRWVQVPQVADTVLLNVVRLPDNKITDFDQEFTDLDERHHLYLLEGMKARAYLKQDAETFNPKLAEQNDRAFREYCEQCRIEWERYKHKPRSVRYGGI
jgi:hypothetical protein